MLLCTLNVRLHPSKVHPNAVACPVSADRAIVVDCTNGLKLTTFACVTVYVDLERPTVFYFSLPETWIRRRTLRLLGRVKPFPQY
jgi:hypothetical protein